jgi:hypothetical protein
MAPPFPPTKLTAKRLLLKQLTPANKTGLTMTAALTQAGADRTTAERKHDAPPDKTHDEPKPTVATPHKKKQAIAKLDAVRERKAVRST